MGITLFICRDLYAYGTISWPRPLTHELIILRNIVVVICAILVLIIIKAKKDGDRDLKEKKCADDFLRLRTLAPN